MKEKTIEKFIELYRKKNLGKTIKVKIRGKSMQPLIPDKSFAEVSVSSLEKLKAGDIVIYYFGKNFVMHRILKKKQDYFLIKGDNRLTFDPLINRKLILGKVTGANGKKIDSLKFRLTKMPIVVLSLITGRIFTKIFAGKNRNILITGTPGTGKTVLAEKLSEKLGYKVINEKDFALKTGTGKRKKKEVEIDTKKFQKKMNEFLKHKKGIIIEGHVLCEMKIKADLVFLLRTKTKILEKRLKKKKYNAVKIQDNLYCEETDYCRKKTLKNYRKITELKNEKSLKSSLQKIIKKLKEIK